MGRFFINTKCSTCGQPRGCCPHTNPNLDDDSRHAAIQREERRVCGYEGWSKDRKRGRRR